VFGRYTGHYILLSKDNQTMKLLGIGLEECATCSGSAGSNAAVANSSDDQIEFTYDEGQGVKDTIVMDGPLSNIYTQALNVYFAKKPIEDDEFNSLSKAFESAAIDSILATQLAAIENKENDDTIDISGLRIVPANMDIVQSPKAVIYSVMGKDSVIDSEIEVIEASHERVKNAGKEFIVFVGPELGADGQVGPIMEYIDFSNVSKINAYNISDKFSRATESYFEVRGIPVVIGFENLVQWLKKRSKGE